MKAEDPQEAAAIQAVGPTSDVPNRKFADRESAHPEFAHPDIQAQDIQNQELLPSTAPSSTPSPQPVETRLLKWIAWGPQGLRAGWSVLLFIVVTVMLAAVLQTAAALLGFHPEHAGPNRFTPTLMAASELSQVIALLGAAAVCALVERRRILDYNLAGPQRTIRFFYGALSGAVALSLLVGILNLAGWVRFGPVSSTGSAALGYAAVWGIAFLGTGLSEEGFVRCYLLATLTRGLNFWWALGIIAVVCLAGFAFAHHSLLSQDIWGVYILAGLGLVPCLLLHLRKSQSEGFWQASWVTSVLFGFMHCPNGGETWLGIFQAGSIGFIFCVSIWLTGSAWWAIGFHAAWDWAQTFFYGATDSGFQPQGHFLTTLPSASSWKSGGTAGLEGSVIGIPVELLVMAALIFIYHRKPGIDISAIDAVS